MLIVEITDGLPKRIQKDIGNDIAAMPEGFILRRSRSATSLLAGDRSRYSVDLNSAVKVLLDQGIGSPSSKIWLGDTSELEGELIGTIKTILDRKFPPPYLKLYHGTSSVRLPLIRQRGLIPVNKKDRIWSSGDDVTVREDAIYLTAIRAQAEYYAKKAVEADKPASPVIIEVLIQQHDYNKLIPDDDFVEEKEKKQKSDWQTSLSYYGQVAFIGDIPPDRIRVIASGRGAKQISQ